MTVGTTFRVVLAGCGVALAFSASAMALAGNKTDLAGKFTAGAQDLKVGHESTYVFRVHNNGPGTTINPGALVHIPKTLEYVSDNGNDCHYYEQDSGYHRVVDCASVRGHGYNLPPGGSVKLHIVLKGHKAGHGQMWGLAEASSGEDDVHKNNRDTYEVHVHS